MKKRICRQLLKSAKYVLSLGFALLVAGVALPYLQAAAAQSPVAPDGTGQADISVWLPEGSVEIPMVLTADYQAPEDLPAGVFYPPAAVGYAFTFGVWQGETVSVSRFDPSIVVSARYEDSEAELAGVTEENLVLWMYDPTTRSWVKTCSSIDIYLNVVAAALSELTPFPAGQDRLAGSVLLTIAEDTTPDLLPQADSSGITTLSLPGQDFMLEVMPDTIDPQAHFEVTSLPSLASSRPLRLLAQPADVKVCTINHSNPAESRQVTGFSQPITISFGYNANTLSLAGGQANLTLAGLQSGRWIDLEELGFRVIRGNNTVAVDTRESGMFSLTAR